METCLPGWMYSDSIHWGDNVKICQECGAEVKVNVGDEVREGDVFYVIEAMKMELDIKSDRDGAISEIHLKDGDAVEHMDIVMNFE